MAFISRPVQGNRDGSSYGSGIGFCCEAFTGLMPLSLLALVVGSFFGVVTEVLLAAVGAVLSFILTCYGEF